VKTAKTDPPATSVDSITKRRNYASIIKKKGVELTSMHPDSISKNEIMDILDRFECRATEDIKRDNKIDADNYENVGQYKLIIKIRKTVEMAFRKDSSRSNYSLDDLLKPGKLWD